ncbi:hypothetical protein JR316_0011482 [Psilocybe cubensis]|uniref:Uncharacterized protein n=1 Tax=Psilocybe cubensis TaxID=181762 RepID=A0ACB8GK65_PSICU|nr:hypothetical protein JR316_0011482 [Psilocybe cubensis]KAH9475921.1 hypothetical protein JR316_0011482 [Psilocybe cubensis]
MSAILTLAAKAIKQNYDCKHLPTPLFNAGNSVLLNATNIKSARPSKRFDAKQYGPFKVVNYVGLHNATPLPALANPAVAQVLDHRKLRSGTQYLISFKGTRPEDAIWVTQPNIFDPNKLIDIYNATNRL